MPFLYFWDPTYIFIIVGLLISGIASWNVNRTFEKYDQYENSKGYTGIDVAQKLLEVSGITNVRVERVGGNLTDYYDSDNKVLKLSEATADSTSIAAIGVAAHECGHALQDHTNYVFLRLRHAIVPAVNIGTQASYFIILVGVFLSMNQTLINIGIFLFSFGLIFQLVTLPVEFDASRRALRVLSEKHILEDSELPYARRTLVAAALTYVAAVVATGLSLLRLLILFGNRNSRN